jgi:DNA primase
MGKGVIKMDGISESYNFILQCNKHLLRDYEASDAYREEINEAKMYLEGRRILEPVCEEHLIGYCLENQKIPDEVKRFGRKEEDDREFDYGYCIRGRVIVPIFSEFGKLEGFATRPIKSGKEFTWWNTPFPKGNHFFLFNKTRQHIFKENKAYIAEGYADVLKLYQEGLNNVCGIMGTALTTRRVGLLARYCDKVCICMDVDKNQSGQKAKDMAVYILNEFGFCKSINVIDGMPEGYDPDEYVTEFGIDKYLELERELGDREINEICKRVRSSRKK